MINYGLSGVFIMARTVRTSGRPAESPLNAATEVLGGGGGGFDVRTGYEGRTPEKPHTPSFAPTPHLFRSHRPLPLPQLVSQIGKRRDALSNYVALKPYGYSQRQ